MGKASQNKKVQRAARTGGGRSSARGSRGSLLFPGIITAVVVLGILLIVLSRSDKGVVTLSVPKLGDHVHDAYGIYFCDTFQPNLTDVLPDPLGIHTHGDGLIHVHPTSSNATGTKAIFKHFADDVGLKVTTTSIELPNGEVRKNGDKCAGKAGEVQFAIWDNPTDETPTMWTGDPNDIPLRDTLEDNRVIVAAFVAPGTDIPKPPSVSELSSPSDVAPTGSDVPFTVITSPTDSSAATTPEQTAPATTPPAAGTDTTGP